MTRYLLIRILSLFPLWLGITFLAFVLGSFAPSDPATVIAYRLSDVPPSAEQIETVRSEFHLDESLPSRYVRWLGQAMSGDLGRWYRTGKPVLAELVTHFPATLQLACLAFVIVLFIALPLGIAAAVKRGSGWDHLAQLVALLRASLPNYWLAYLLMLFFRGAARLVAGRGTGAERRGNFARLDAGTRHGIRFGAADAFESAGNSKKLFGNS